ncbi:ArsC family reductase [Orbaceae bacterium ESL0727]|nr:ArsC family reductase [Orbaceae bacterium ESL0727]
MFTIYGIKNCDTMKKAMHWLDEHHISYQFHNYKTDGLTPELLHHFLQLVSWQDLLNTKGMTWRKLEESVRNETNNEAAAIKIMLANPSIIKRPLLIHGDHALLVFSPENYQHFIDKVI